MRLSIFCVLLFCASQLSEAYKILVYNSKFGHSHSTFLGQITDILADAGHNVTSLLPIINPHIADGTEKSLKIYVQPDPVVKNFYDTQQHVNFFYIDMLNPVLPFLVGSVFANNFRRTCKKVVEEPGLIERLKAEKFDVMITENFDVCGIGISHAIAPKSVISSSSTFLFGWQFDEFGVESALSYRPNLILSRMDVHSIISRFWNVYAELCIRCSFWFTRRDVNKVLKDHFGPNYPTISKQSSNVAFVLTNSEPLIETEAPITSRIINVPGIGAKPAKPLNQAIARFPEITFIWKYENLEDDFAKEALKVKNLVLAKWMPQVDILNHKNLALFITHGGMGSTREMVLRGVPGLFIPVFFDQPRNAGMAEFNGVGRVYDKFELHDDEKLADMIREVLDNKKYRENAERLSRMLAKKPFTSRKLLIKHVEFAAEFGTSTALRPESADMTFIEYHNLDLAAVFMITFILAHIICTKIIVSLFSYFLQTKKIKIG